MSRPENTKELNTVPPLEAITFDVTHTLIHAPRLAEIYWQVLRRHGHTVSLRGIRQEIPRVWQEFSCRVDHRVDRFTSHPKGARGYWQDFLCRLCQRLNTQEPSRFAGAELFDRFARAESWEMYPDVPTTLLNLKTAGLRLGVVSNWDHRLPRLLKDLELLPWFDAVVYSSSCGSEKPHPHIFQQCLRELGVRAPRALHVGDRNIDDVEGAQAAGLRALRIDRNDLNDPLHKLLEPLLRQPVVRPFPVGVRTWHNPGRGRHARH